MRRFVGLIYVALLVGGCTPETCPFSLAPSCPSCDYHPCKEAVANPDCPLPFPFPSKGIPVEVPETEGKLALTDLVNIALCNSTDTRRTWAMARQAAAEYGIARAPLYPEVNFEPSAQRERQGDFFGHGSLTVQRLWRYGPQLAISFLILDFGATKSAAEQMREVLMAANFQHNREIQTVVQVVMNDYYDYMAAIGEVEGARADLADALVALDAANVKHRAGISDITDVLQARTTVAQRELALLTQEQTLSDAVANLTASIGLPSTMDLDIAQLPILTSADDILESVDSLVAHAYQVRPDLFSAWAELRSKKAQIDAARSNRWPKINFNGQIGSTWFSGGLSDTYDFIGRVSLQQPVFKGWYYKNKVAQAVAELERQQAEVRALELAISKEVVSSYRDLAIATQKINSADQYVNSAAGSYEATLQRYKAGTVDFVTLENSLTMLADSRTQLVLANQDWYSSITNLSYAIGSIQRPCR